MIHTTNYTNAFIEVADDCKMERGVEPPLKEKKSIARMQYELIKLHPYRYTSDELIFELHVIRNQIDDGQKDAERVRFFSKGQACMRASNLPKKYGWGIHFDEHAKMDVYGVDSAEYAKLKNDPGLTHKKAMRSARK